MWAVLTFNWSSMHYSLQLLSRFLLLASVMLIAFSMMIHSARRWIRTHPTLRISRELSLDSSALNVITTSMPWIKWAFGLSLMFSAGTVVGWHAKALEDIRSEDGGIIKVHQKIDSRHALVQNLDKDGNPISKEWKLAVCPHTSAPSFDEGCTYEVGYQVTSTDLGICELFTGENGYTKELNCQ